MVLFTGRDGRAFVAHFVLTVLLIEEINDVLKRGIRDVRQGLFGQESLVGRNDDIGHRNKPSQYIVVDDVVRVIVEEHVRFLLVYIEAGRADPILLSIVYSCGEKNS